MKSNKEDHTLKPEKVTFFLLALDADEQNATLNSLDELGIQTVPYAIAVTEEEKKEVIAKYHKLLNILQKNADGPESSVRKLFAIARGTQQTIKILKHITRPLERTSMEMLQGLDPEVLVEILKDEKPGDIAIALRYVDTARAASTISMLPHGISSGVIRSLAAAGSVAPEDAWALEGRLRSKLSRAANEIPELYESPSGGIYHVVEILNNTDRGVVKLIIEGLEKSDPPLANELKKNMLNFDDLFLFHDKSLQRILREIDRETLAKALKGTSADVREVILRNITEQEASKINKEMELMGSVSLRDVGEAQEKIMDIVRMLQEAGEIIIARPGEEDLLV